MAVILLVLVSDSEGIWEGVGSNERESRKYGTLQNQHCAPTPISKAHHGFTWHGIKGWRGCGVMMIIADSNSRYRHMLAYIHGVQELDGSIF